MQVASFVGGPYDGAQFTFVQRMPENFVAEIECYDVDTNDPKFREAFFAIAEVEPSIEENVYIRNAKALAAKYSLDTDEHGTPFYRYIGWTVNGVTSAHTGKT